MTERDLFENTGLFLKHINLLYGFSMKNHSFTKTKFFIKLPHVYEAKFIMKCI